jgi:hypothetical protein
MGNYYSHVYADSLCGLTKFEAVNFINKNRVYLDNNNKKCRISKIRVLNPDGTFTKDLRLNRINVTTDENGKINKILCLG